MVRKLWLAAVPSLLIAGGIAQRLSPPLHARQLVSQLQRGVQYPRPATDHSTPTMFQSQSTMLPRRRPHHAAQGRKTGPAAAANISTRTAASAGSRRAASSR